MKTLRLIYTILLATLISCGNGSDATSNELKASEAAGRRDAEAALALPENTMERENAILKIRARETRMRDAGFESCADAYIKVVGRTLGFD